jgi:hypothetical protein
MKKLILCIIRIIASGFISESRKEENKFYHDKEKQ